MERIAAARGQSLSGLGAAELDALWNEVKSGGAGNAAEKRRAFSADPV
jgi:hypothetical protein